MKTLLRSVLTAASMVAFSFLVLPATATAQENSSALKLEEIIVTAERREANLQDVPIPVTSFSSLGLIEANFVDLTDLADMVPGLSIGSSAGELQVQIALRGLAPAQAGIGTDTSVALYVDDVYIGRMANNFRNAMLGVEQIQVLRGPQGTLYGRNAVGGAIVVTTRKPTEETQAEVRMKIGNFESRMLSAIVSGQLAEGVYASIGAKADSRNRGFLLNLANDRWTGGLKDEDSFRAVLRFTPGDRWDINVIADYSDYAGSGNGPARNILDYINFPGETDADVDPNDVGWNTFYQWPTGGEDQNDLTSARMLDAYDYLEANGFDQNLAYTAGGGFVERSGLSFSVKYEFDNMTLTSVTAKRYQDNEATISSYSRNTPTTVNMELNDQEQFSQEIRLVSTGEGALEWIAGVAYFEEDIEQLNIFRRVLCTDAMGNFNGTYLGQADCRDGNAAGATNLSYNAARIRSPSIYVKSLAVYGEATYHFTDRLSGTAGLRYSDEEKDWDIYFKNFTTLPEDGFAGENTHSWDSLTPKLAIKYALSENVMAFGSYTEGFKSGGFNATSTAEFGQIIDQEESQQYEIGFKSDFADGRARVNVAAFFNQYEGLQLRLACVEDGTGNCASSQMLGNASGAEITGVEVEFSVLAAEGFVISGFVSYLDAVFTDFVLSPTDDRTGNKLPRAPEWQYNIVGSYSTQVSDSAEIGITASYHWTDSEFFRSNNTGLDENQSNDGVNARFTYRNLDSNWEVALYGTNLTDQHTRTNGFQIGALTVAAGYNLPRMYGIEFIWRHAE